MKIRYATRAAATVSFVLLLGLSLHHPTAAQSADSFFAGKTITLIVGSSAGGGTDNSARLIARHIDRHIPGNPRVIVSNMAGAGGMRAANHLYNRVDPDGLTWSTMNTGALYGKATGNTALKFELEKFIFIGQAYDEAQMLYLRSATPYTSFDAVRKANREGKKPKMGAQAKAHSSNVVVKIINEILDVEFDVVYGYPGTPEILLDIERGALDGRSQGTGSLLSTKRHWIDDNFIRILVTSKSERDDRLPNIPSISELAPAGNKQYLGALFASQFIGRSIVLPPKVPADRVKTLRDAFAATVKDKAFLEDAEKLGLEVGLIRGEQMNRDIEQTLGDTKLMALYKKILTAE